MLSLRAPKYAAHFRSILADLGIETKTLRKKKLIFDFWASLEKLDFLTISKSSWYLGEAALNDWFASGRIPVFAQRTLRLSGGKHCKSLEGNVWQKDVSTSWKEKKDYGGRSTLFRRSFIENKIEQCLICLMKPTDKLPCLTTWVGFIVKFSENYYKLRYKPRGNNPEKPLKLCKVTFDFVWSSVMYIILEIPDIIPVAIIVLCGVD